MNGTEMRKVMAVACPYCGARAEKRCYRIMGPYTFVPIHKARKRAARWAELWNANLSRGMT